MVYFSYIKSYDGESTGGTFDCNDTDRIALHERVIFFYCPDKVGTTAEKRKGNMNRENKKRNMKKVTIKIIHAQKVLFVKTVAASLFQRGQEAITEITARIACAVCM